LVARHLREIVEANQIHLAMRQRRKTRLADSHHAAARRGTVPATVLDVLTSGNHIWDKREIYDYFPRQPRLAAPANYVDTLRAKA